MKAEGRNRERENRKILHLYSIKCANWIIPKGLVLKEWSGVEGTGGKGKAKAKAVIIPKPIKCQRRKLNFYERTVSVSNGNAKLTAEGTTSPFQFHPISMFHACKIGDFWNWKTFFFQTLVFRIKFPFCSCKLNSGITVPPGTVTTITTTYSSHFPYHIPHLIKKHSSYQI